jgi:1-acyl-sn-glycerol-3-phosphate acyltransferase
MSSSRELSFMAKKELFDVPIFGAIIKRCNAFPIKRGGSDRHAIKLAMQLLKENHTLLMFPEGSRNKTGELAEGLSGAGFFALKTDAAVVPCAIIGSYKLFHKMKIVFGEPIDFTDLKMRKAKPLEASQIIMEHIREVIDRNKF